MAPVLLKNLAATRDFGCHLAEGLLGHGLPAVMLHGDLGCGKTALVSAVMSFLPGADKIEVSSPSFSLCNYYLTVPPVLHCDLYRCAAHPPEELLEALDDHGQLVLVEWAEFLPARFLPAEYLDISFKMVNDARALEIGGNGAQARALAEKLRCFAQL